MKTGKNILIAFVLNLLFSVFEFFGGAFTGSVAIVSDAVHDLGDAASIGISLLLEHKSKKQPDETHTYGYARYSVLGSVITTVILLLGSSAVILNAVKRIFNPVEINYNGMLVFAVIGAIVNLFAAWFTHKGESLNQKAVNLHMLEDVLGWLAVLVGAAVMKFTDFAVIDPLMSIAVAVFILINAVKNLKSVTDIFVEKTPANISVKEIEEHLCEIDGVINVHHSHVWSTDGYRNLATMHIVTDYDHHEIKEKVRAELKEHGIDHCTLELEAVGEHCENTHCHSPHSHNDSHHHHHYHHH